jgi:signal transduction histidine kinase
MSSDQPPVDLERLLPLDRYALVGRLAAGVVHEINGPLTVILGFAQALAGEADPTRVREDLQLIEHEARRCSDELKGFLQLARSAATQTSGQALIGAELERAVRLVAFLARRSRTEVRLDLGALAPQGDVLVVGAAPDVLYMVLELLHNAIVATADGRVQLTAAGTGSTVVVTVEDTGSGLDPDLAARAFEPYVTTRDDGTGLGLPVTRALARRLGGDLTLEPAPGGGVRALLTLERADTLEAP